MKQLIFILGLTTFMITLAILFFMRTNASSKKRITSLKKNSFICNAQPQTEEIKIQKALKALQSDLSWESPSDVKPLFSSRNYFSKNGILSDLAEEKTQIYPPVPNAWLLEHHLDYSDPNILSKDSDGDGFSNLEEWLGSDPWQAPGTSPSDPNDPESRPLLWTKLRCYSSDLHKRSYRFDFTGVDRENSEEIFQLQPRDPTPNLNPQGKNTLNTKIRYLKIGQKVEGLPLQIVSFKEKQTVHKEITYDVSELTVLNPQTGEQWILLKKSTLHPEPTVFTILEEVSFLETLHSPPNKITVKPGDFFTLESLFTSEKSLSDKKDRETYQFINVDNHGAILLRNGRQYVVPILSSSCN